jgi:subtilisin family serine protease
MPFKGGSSFEGDLETRLRNGDPGRFFRCLLDLTEQVDLVELGRRIDLGNSMKAERRRIVISALETVASRQQQEIEPLLDRLLDEGKLYFVRRVAIVNRLVVEGTAEAILRLSGHPAVGRVMHDWTSGELRGKSGNSPSEPVRAVVREDSWAIPAAGIDRLWEAGLDGRGVLVAVIDTGVYEQHEQLSGRMQPGERGWYDPVEGRESPYDSHGHGTMILSQAVGGNPGGRIVGVAPAASWAAALGNLDNHYSRYRMTLAADWILRTAKPDVLVNAWSHDEGECTDFDLRFIEAWQASGIFVVFPAGNAGPVPASGEAPAQLAGAYPDGRPVFSVSGLSPGMNPFPESSRGPSRCGSEFFPRMAAPGAGLPYAFIGGPDIYGKGNGTSLSAGFIGGCAALLLQADPELLPWELEEILISSARDLPPAGWDPVSGAGMVDMPAALEIVMSR